MTAPRYTGLQGEEIPVVTSDEGRVRVQLIAGKGEQQAAFEPAFKPAFEPLTDVAVQTIALKTQGKLRLHIPTAHNIFFYVVRGTITVNGVEAQKRSLLEFDNNSEVLDIGAVTDALVLLCHATPYGEPVVSHGPFVMNTRDEIQTAIDDYRAGKLG